MKTTPALPEDLSGVFAVPPLARMNDARRSIDFAQNDRVVRHIGGGRITRFIYGGNAFLYHISLGEYEQLLAWLSELAGDVWAIPSLGPAYGRAMDQARLLRKYRFPCAMVLPGNDPRDAAGLERGYRDISETANTRLIAYLKAEDNFGSDKEAGLDAVARLIDDGVCIGIKYAVVRQDPARDDYLEALLKRVHRKFVISGIGERPAVIHLRDWKLPGFTTGSGCIAPRMSQMLFERCEQRDFDKAEGLRAEFVALEDLRDAWGQAVVLHVATELAGVARMGPILPYSSALSAEQQQRVQPIAEKLRERNSQCQPQRHRGTE